MFPLSLTFPSVTSSFSCNLRISCTSTKHLFADSVFVVCRYRAAVVAMAAFRSASSKLSCMLVVEIHLLEDPGS